MKLIFYEKAGGNLSYRNLIGGLRRRWLKRFTGVRSDEEVYLVAMTVSNAETSHWIVEEGKVVGHSYDDVPSGAEYIYNNSGKLIPLVVRIRCDEKKSFQYTRNTCFGTSHECLSLLW